MGEAAISEQAADVAQTPSALTADDPGAKLGTWNAVIRRARIGRQRKVAALTVGSYAGENGRGIKCGVARLALDCEIGYSTARRYLAWMRDVGLIELVKAGNRKAGRADEYRLIIAAEVYQRLDIPDADTYRKLVEELNAGNRSGEKGRRLRSPIVSAEATGSEAPSALDMVSAEPSYLRSLSTPSALTQDEPPPSSNHLPREEHLPAGGAPPPDPRRPPSPPGPGIEESNSLYEPLTQAQDQQGESLPREHASHEADAELRLVADNPRPAPPPLFTPATVAAAAARRRAAS